MYACTFHSCLGLTLDHAGFDLHSEMFAHGQLYTALSCIRKQDDGLVLLPNLSQNDTANVIYSNMLI